MAGIGEDYKLLSPSSRSGQKDDTQKDTTEDSFENVSAPPRSENGPMRVLSYIDGIAVLVGIIIGSGVFSSPGLALERCGSPGEVLLAWSTSGVLVWMCSNCYIELGGMMPTAGGDFDYLNRAFGERAAFSFAWYNFFIGKSGSQAIIATIFGRYFQAVLLGNIDGVLNYGSGSSGESWLTKGLAIILIILITALNCIGLKESAVLSVVLTATKVMLILSVFVFAVFYISLPAGSTDAVSANLSSSHSFDGSSGILGFGSSLVACLFSYDGFADANFLQEELKNPIQDLPRIITHGVAIVTVCYLLINVAYLCVLPVDTIINTGAIAVQFGTTASSLFGGGSALALCLAFGVALSTAGSVNGSVMAGGRAFYATGRSGQAPKIIGQLNRFGAPWAALVAQGTWTVVLLALPGSNFSTLLDYFGPTSWMFYALSASALLRLRYKEPNAHRPFKAPIFAPYLVISLAAVIITGSIAKEPVFTLLAFGFVGLSVPFHLLMERKTRLSYMLYTFLVKCGIGGNNAMMEWEGWEDGGRTEAVHSPLSQVPDGSEGSEGAASDAEMVVVGGGHSLPSTRRRRMKKRGDEEVNVPL